ncbi:GAF domain-containing protein [Paenibacillus sp. TRM 82003]|nr:GAF domain-containing protein [Paenibacillus sp. TRM 82003]
MLAERTGFIERLDDIRQLTNSDFCAAARYDSSARLIRWVAAVGNRNQRYVTMTKRPGQGVAGEVVRFGRMVTRLYREGERKRSDDFLMHAEDLLSVAAVPCGSDGMGSGVLLIGRRTSIAYEAKDTALLLNAAACFTYDA